MRPALLTALSATAALAGPAVINGVALENLSCYPLSRARVKLSRLNGNKLETVASRLATRSGQFVFQNLEPGFYVLSGTRAGFAETAFGERRGGAPAVPIELKPDQSMFAELRIKRLGAVAGKLLDENRVGLPGVAVSAYAPAGTARLVASATSDDRGIYRITGLHPGSYHIRTGATTLDDGLSLLPTYFPFTTPRFRDAGPVEVDLDRDSTDTDILPAPGALLTLFGTTTGCTLGTPVKATLSHETGRTEVNTFCQGQFRFRNLLPEDYELLVEGFLLGEPVAQFESVSMRRARNMGAVRLESLRRFDVKSNIPVKELQLVFRRTDAAGPSEARAVDPTRLVLTPGFWEVGAVPPPNHYVKDVRAQTGWRGPPAKPDPDWFNINIAHASLVAMTVDFSPRAARLSGRVTITGVPAIGAPVFLFPITKPTKAQVNGLKQVLSDPNGRYEFTNLAPGTYLLASSWDLPVASEDTLNSIQAVRVEIAEGVDGKQDVEALLAR